MILYVGLDWADRDHMVFVQDEEGSEVLLRKVANTTEGLSDFGRWLFERVADGAQLRAAIEKPEGRIVDFLLDHGVEVYPINPKALDRARDRYRMGASKSDEFDAYVLADYLRTDGKRLVPLRPNSPEASELKMLTRDYHRLVRQQTRLVNQTKATLKEYYPRPLEIFEDLATVKFQEFVKAYPTPDALSKLTFPKWQKFAKSHRMGVEAIQEKWEVLKGGQIPVPEHAVRAKSRLALVLVQELRVISQAVNEYRKEIEAFFGKLPAAELTGDLPGAKTGTMIPTIFAELGDAAERWSSFRHLQAQGGTTPYTRKSGKSRSVHFRFCCNKHLRYSTYWLAMTSLRQAEWAKAYYDTQRSRGNSHHQALRALSAKWLKILFVMWRDQVPYREEIHLANIARQHMRQTVFV